MTPKLPSSFKILISMTSCRRAFEYHEELRVKWADKQVRFGKKETSADIEKF